MKLDRLNRSLYGWVVTGCFVPQEIGRNFEIDEEAVR